MIAADLCSNARVVKRGRMATGEKKGGSVCAACGDTRAEDEEAKRVSWGRDSRGRSARR